MSKLKRLQAIRPTSVYRGVYWDWQKARWRAEIQVGGQRYKLGRYTSQDEAALAYDAAAILRGVADRCNFDSTR